MTDTICYFSRISEKTALSLPITEYRDKFDRSIQLGVFISTGKLELYDKESIDSKHDKEYEYLKSIGYL